MELLDELVNSTSFSFYFYSKVGYGGADVGLSGIAYTAERNTLVDYSHSVTVAAMRWISKPPGKLPPVTNIIRTFDFHSWIMIGASSLSIIAAMLVACRISQSYGVESHLDSVRILIWPLATLTAEKMPRCFKSRKHSSRHSWFPPGFSGNSLLLLWTVMASFLSMAFLSNIRAILMIPVLEDPIDTTEDLFKQSKLAIIGPEGGFMRGYLSGSSNIWERTLGE